MPGVRLNVIYSEDLNGLGELICSLYNQYEFFFANTPFYKIFENESGVSWGRQAQLRPIQVSGVPQPTPEPRPPARTN